MDGNSARKELSKSLNPSAKDQSRFYLQRNHNANFCLVLKFFGIRIIDEASLLHLGMQPSQAPHRLFPPPLSPSPSPSHGKLVHTEQVDGKQAFFYKLCLILSPVRAVRTARYISQAPRLSDISQNGHSQRFRDCDQELGHDFTRSQYLYFVRVFWKKQLVWTRQLTFECPEDVVFGFQSAECGDSNTSSHGC